MTRAELLRKLKTLDYKLTCLLNIDQNPKTIKNVEYGYKTGILYMLPADLRNNEIRGAKNVCPKASTCKEDCLNEAGQGGFNPTVKQSRFERKKLFFEYPELFFQLLRMDIDKLIRIAEKENLKPLCRLNGLSDILYETIMVENHPYGYSKTIFEMYPNVIFYDYTKIFKRLSIQTTKKLSLDIFF